MIQTTLEPLLQPKQQRQVEKQAERFCQEILSKVSRTFALSIRFLPGQLGRAVLCAYLLCRIADTLEDDPAVATERKVLLLECFLECFESSELADKFAALAHPVTGEAAHVELVQHTDLVFVMFRTLPAQSQIRVRHWVVEMVRGMKKFVGLHPQGIRIQTLSEYQEYCYYVAGTVGHLLSDLWHEHSLLVGEREYELLLPKCEAFGEALQTVNILKDIAWDVEHENAIYVPEQSLLAVGSSHQLLLSPEHTEHNRAAVAGLIELAWRDLDEALEYTLLIPRAAVPIRLFCILPLLFAYATLRDLCQSTAMLQSGGSVKISRNEVKSLMLAGPMSVVSDRGVRWLIKQVRRAPFVLGETS
ncbi:phytoene/squalene synthase family protein [Leptolyngbya sp. FACHB-261]|uniref:phytoene/squalene synthase family protein n=1 Tax=Leptolyngbya sp. FACHB-261 TaxID=2692806 RepID=UPI0016856813|nr:phytoene/squalene synthase family protein [Leptolyngbya sp. FACHB-261]MBD2104903.1 phytoene/squalene synthase family protein [Leptolyngbya sp. FACHB-261]